MANYVPLFPAVSNSTDLKAPTSSRLKFVEAMRFGSGYSSRSLVGYIAGELSNVTPAAYADYVQGQNWPLILGIVRKLLLQHSQEEVSKILHEQFINILPPELIRQEAQCK